MHESSRRVKKGVISHANSVDSTINIAAALHEIGMLLELKGGRYFQARAYKNAAHVLSQLDSSLRALIEEDRLKTIKGIGGAITAQGDDVNLPEGTVFTLQLDRPVTVLRR